MPAIHAVAAANVAIRKRRAAVKDICSLIASGPARSAVYIYLLPTGTFTCMQFGHLAFDYVHALKVAGPPVAKLLAVAIGIVVVTRLSRGLVTKVPEGLQRQAGYALPIAIKLAGALIALALLGVQISAVTGLLAAVGLGATLLLTPVGQNLIAGFLAGIDDVVSLGDVITVKDQVGKVVRKGTLSLGVEMPDGSIVYVPNTKVIDDELVNHNRVRGDRIDVEVLIDDPTQRHSAVAAMQATVDSIEWRIQDLPAEVIFQSLNGDSLTLVGSVWIEDRFEERRYKSMLLTALVDALDERGISLGDTSSLEIRAWPAVTQIAARLGDGVADVQPTAGTPAQTAAMDRAGADLAAAERSSRDTSPVNA